MTARPSPRSRSGLDTVNSTDLDGNTQNDTLWGGAGDDTLYGNRRDDRIVGGRGDDTADDGYPERALSGSIRRRTGPNSSVGRATLS